MVYKGLFKMEFLYCIRSVTLVTAVGGWCSNPNAEKTELSKNCAIGSCGAYASLQNPFSELTFYLPATHMCLSYMCGWNLAF